MRATARRRLCPLRSVTRAPATWRALLARAIRRSSVNATSARPSKACRRREIRRTGQGRRGPQSGSRGAVNVRARCTGARRPWRTRVPSAEQCPRRPPRSDRRGRAIPAARPAAGTGRPCWRRRHRPSRLQQILSGGDTRTRDHGRVPDRPAEERVDGTALRRADADSRSVDGHMVAAGEPAGTK